MRKNKQIADIFNEMADILEIQEVKWKPRAYRKAAQTVQSLSEDVEKVYREGGKDALEELSGIGESIAEKIEEFIKKGRIKEYEKLRKKVPKGVESLTHVPGLGPKSAKKLADKLGISSLEGLKKAAEEHEIRDVKGFGEKTEEDILRGLKLVKQQQERSLLGEVLPLAQDIEDNLNSLDYVKKAVVAGSLRRKRETIGDIDILCTTTKPEKVVGHFTQLPSIKHVLSKGSSKSTVIFEQGVQCDLRILKPESFGAALIYFTGSKAHNVEIRKIAMDRGWKLSEYGLFGKRGKRLAGKTEEEVYKKLKLDFIPPELRENRGEVEAAKEGRLPALVQLKDIKADLQVHTKWSDGNASIQEMVEACEGRGYKYMAITDHSKSEHVAGGMSEKELKKYLKELDRVDSKLRVFKGSEVDILKDGSMDYSNKVLKELDIVLASIHSNFRMDSKTMTKRLINAFENPYVNVWAHPTARIIQRREAIDFDVEKVFQAAKDNDVALEVDSYPDRLDLKDTLVRTAVEMGCKLVISTDSHSPEHLHYIELGVATARRGWAEKKDIVNAQSVKKVEKWLKK